MTQTPPKNKPPEPPGYREIVEKIATAYFGACRKIARALNRRREKP